MVVARVCKVEANDSIITFCLDSVMIPKLHVRYRLFIDGKKHKLTYGKSMFCVAT